MLSYSKIILSFAGVLYFLYILFTLNFSFVSLTVYPIYLFFFSFLSIIIAQYFDIYRFKFISGTNLSFASFVKYSKNFMSPGGVGVDLLRIANGEKVKFIVFNKLLGVSASLFLIILFANSNYLYIFSAFFLCISIAYFFDCFLVFSLSVVISVLRIFSFFILDPSLFLLNDAWLVGLVGNLLSPVSIFPGGVGVREFIITSFQLDPLLEFKMLEASVVSRVSLLVSFLFWSILDFIHAKRFF